MEEETCQETVSPTFEDKDQDDEKTKLVRNKRDTPFTEEDKTDENQIHDGVVLHIAKDKKSPKESPKSLIKPQDLHISHEIPEKHDIKSLVDKKGITPKSPTKLDEHEIPTKPIDDEVVPHITEDKKSTKESPKSPIKPQELDIYHDIPEKLDIKSPIDKKDITPKSKPDKHKITKKPTDVEVVPHIMEDKKSPKESPKSPTKPQELDKKDITPKSIPDEREITRKPTEDEIVPHITEDKKSPKEIGLQVLDCLENCLLASRVYAAQFHFQHHPGKEVFERLLRRFREPNERCAINKPTRADEIN
ncbi:unnamed protein product [Psylliodes chrysocephalus]|uniref:Uncharacterized protein n=1 Tax=Psylliodes chrysocephalus TaxID=3402493 RepID=A0A9P0GER3_9CUCU|nr:unnamed protein product [Psylliodes chrysocephala]